MATALSPRPDSEHRIFPESIPPVENGGHLSAREFMRRYEAMPEVKKAELIDGIVYMASPVRVRQHGEPDGLIQGWLAIYPIATPGVKHATNSSVLLGPRQIPQPDASLRLAPERGGRSKVDDECYLQGPPELAIEIAASTVSLDVRAKLTVYRKAGVREYLTWRTEDEVIDWWSLEDDDYVPLAADAAGIIRSRAFPGLWLDAQAALQMDGNRLMASLQLGLQSPEHAAFVAPGV